MSVTGRFSTRPRSRAELAAILKRDGVVDVAVVGELGFVQSPTTIYILHGSLVRSMNAATR